MAFFSNVKLNYGVIAKKRNAQNYIESYVVGLLRFRRGLIRLSLGCFPTKHNSIWLTAKNTYFWKWTRGANLTIRGFSRFNVPSILRSKTKLPLRFFRVSDRKQKEALLKGGKVLQPSSFFPLRASVWIFAAKQKIALCTKFLLFKEKWTARPPANIRPWNSGLNLKRVGGPILQFPYKDYQVPDFGSFDQGYRVHVDVVLSISTQQRPKLFCQRLPFRIEEVGQSVCMWVAGPRTSHRPNCEPYDVTCS